MKRQIPFINTVLSTFSFMVFMTNCTSTDKPKQADNTYQSKADSILTSKSSVEVGLKKPWDTTLIEEFLEMDKTDQKYRSGDDNYFIRNNVFQSYIDSVNTKRVIEIIKVYGYPNAERLKKKVNASIILMHAPEFYFPELKKILEVENKLGNIPKYEYEILKWHLSGRIGKGP